MNFHYHQALCLSLLYILSLSSASNISRLFESWCRDHGKTYSSERERFHRLKVFEDNYEFITQHNSNGNSTYTLGLNAFADLTHHEFKSSKLGLSARANLESPRFEKSSFSSSLDVPTSIDWRKEGAVTRVKNQGSCGACWSFSATGAIEGINKIVTGSLISVSEQELVDCDKTFNEGCGGGLMDYAFQFVIKNHGIDNEEDYPYKAKEGSCNTEKLNRLVVTIDDFVDIPPYEEKRLLRAVAKQPVSVGICAGERAFQLYSKGIFTGPCSTSLDHAVLIVGYGSEKGMDYWIVKNSWGQSWGMKGYVHMHRNSGNPEGVCGINMLASYPTKSGPNPPPSPPPGPMQCDLLRSCPKGHTCCCTWHFIGFCLSWKCCESDSAVGCSDLRHCCPLEYPVYDTSQNQCLKNVTTEGRVHSRRASFRKPSSLRAIFGEWIF